MTTATKKQRPVLTFGGLKNSEAKTLAVFLQKLQATRNDLVSITFHGQWIGRRFSISEINESQQYTPKPVRNFEAGTLTMPILPASDWETYIHTLRSFGMQIESAERKSRPGFNVVHGPDGETHRVRRGHHIAACGLRGPWPDESIAYLDGSSIDDISLSCVACEKSHAGAK